MNTYKRYKRSFKMMGFGFLFVVVTIVALVVLLNQSNGNGNLFNRNQIFPNNNQATNPGADRFCSHCGAGLQDDWTHCPQCGAPIES